MEITDLSPGSSYSFRVSAVNRFGTGLPSQPSPYFKIPDAAPSKAPEQVSEMYGSVGTLSFTWTELNPEDLTGINTGYKLFWRKKTGNDDRWQKDVVYGHINRYVALIGVENYFLEYEIKVGAFNNLGDGPNSTVFTVMSAEDIPLATPHNVWGQDYNSTAIHVFWDPVQNTREDMKGKLRGFRILCWYDGVPNELYWSYLWCENCVEAIFIGLKPDSSFWVNVQVFNSAGFGPKGEDAYMTTFIYPIRRYPEYVKVASHGPDSVYVEWRGVASGKHEEDLQGYKVNGKYLLLTIAE
ncbi:contactin-like [Pomacea canaliculata]|uniref:contactin-like n=1 Tax=Pomacea canaliculata TaxID=400727 RepID=UPI000D72F3CC|nr:contactin-like [Pomacea canaliculata]